MIPVCLKFSIDFQRLELTLGEFKVIRISLDIGGASWRKVQKFDDDQKSFIETFEYHGDNLKDNNPMIIFTSLSLRALRTFFT